MQSAKWLSMTNAEVDDDCGTAGGPGALHFFGTFHRSVRTQDLNVVYGGRVEADLLISPIGFDFSHPKCKTAYQGGVTLQYSIDAGNNWHDMAYYDASIWRRSNFFNIKVEVPADGRTNHTRFQFIQLTFADDRDGWALDNVRVFHYFKPGWNHKSSYLDGIESTHTRMQRAQCCFDTEWCESRYSSAELEQCNDLPWYHNQKYILSTADICVCIAAFVGILKFVYVSVMGWLMTHRLPFQDEFEGLFQFEAVLKLVPPRFRPRKKLKDLVANVHQSARLVQSLREALGDDPVFEVYHDMYI